MSETEKTAQALAQLLQREEPEVTAAAGDLTGRHLVRAAVVLRHRNRGRRRAVGVGALALAGALFVGGWLSSGFQGGGVDLSAALSGATLVAPPDSTARLELADGARVELRPDSRLELGETSQAITARLASGTAGIVTSDETDRPWNIQAGRFNVTADPGGKLAVAWSEGSGSLLVDLYEGDAEVRGPMDGEKVDLHPGQRLRVDEASGQLSLTPLIEAELLVASAKPAPPVHDRAAPAAAVPSGPTATANVPATGTTVSWSKLVSKGDFDAVLAAAERRGVAACMSSCSLDDLYALALAARYSGRSGLASQGWTTLRSRFPGSGRGSEGAFFLARQAQGAGRHAEALRWYNAYLSEAPGGRYSADALGGKMMATARSSGKAAAKPIARAYLELYPKGVHADGARGILSSR
jgi:TolA-binding protein